MKGNGVGAAVHCPSFIFSDLLTKILCGLPFRNSPCTLFFSANAAYVFIQQGLTIRRTTRIGMENVPDGGQGTERKVLDEYRLSIGTVRAEYGMISRKTHSKYQTKKDGYNCKSTK